ncbi:hypothetical protein Mapa_017281 [Marchantia paleacea]|nr:hypothetical protein Mapa_017281 [Marchantia paleacea]
MARPFPTLRMIFVVKAILLTLLRNAYSARDFRPGIELTTDPVCFHHDILRTGQALCSLEGNGALVITDDGNLQLLELNPPQSPRILWSAGVFTSAERSLLLSNDGELIFFDYSGRNATWRSNYHGPITDTYYAFITSTGDLVTVRGDNEIVWSLGTYYFQQPEMFQTVSPQRFHVDSEIDDCGLRSGCLGWNPH